MKTIAMTGGPGIDSEELNYAKDLIGSLGIRVLFIEQNRSSGEPLDRTISKIYAEKLFNGLIAIESAEGIADIVKSVLVLPEGLPKILIISGAVQEAVQLSGKSNVAFFSTFSDISGLNKVSKAVLRNAVTAMAGMIGFRVLLPDEQEKEQGLMEAW